MWQITLEELITDSFRPVKDLIHPGSWGYMCPVCGECVGIYRDDEYGFIYRRDVCRNGHKVNWNE